MNRRWKVAMIGCGWAGERHARAFRHAGAQVSWAIDVNRERAEALRADQDHTQVGTEYRAALADRDVDAVDIFLPHSLHAQVAVEAAEAGKHVLCEKPIADSLEQADRMIAVAGRAGVVLMIAENEVFNPLYRKVRGLLDDGVIGHPALVQLTRECYLTQSFLHDRPWFLNAQIAAGGMMMSGGVHSFEMLRRLLGEIESVYALRARQRFAEMEGDDTSIAAIRFRDGTVGTVVESFVMKSLVTAAGPEVQTLRIDGDLGSLVVRDSQTIQIFSERPDLTIAGSLTEHAIHVPQADTFALEIEHFLESVATGHEPITSGRSQRRPLEVVLAAYRSMETGLPITVS
jgi:predicted dehydrogenase